MLTSLKEHVANTNKENTNEVQLSPEKFAAYTIELVEQENFLKFHQDISNGVSTIVNVCHCSAALDSRAPLRKHNVKFKDAPFGCDCGKQCNLPAPLNQNLQEDDAWLSALLRDGVLGYMCQSSNSGPSPDQPGHGSCAHEALPLLTLDPRAR